MYKFYIYIHTYFLFLSLYIIHVYIFISYKIILNLFNLLIFSSIDTIRTLIKLNKILVKKTSDVSLTHETFFSAIESDFLKRYITRAFKFSSSWYYAYTYPTPWWDGSSCAAR